MSLIRKANGGGKSSLTRIGRNRSLKGGIISSNEERDSARSSLNPCRFWSEIPMTVEKSSPERKERGKRNTGRGGG